jgi:hypothetical protein
MTIGEGLSAGGPVRLVKGNFFLLIDHLLQGSHRYFPRVAVSVRFAAAGFIPCFEA